MLGGIPFDSGPVLSIKRNDLPPSRVWAGLNPSARSLIMCFTVNRSLKSMLEAKSWLEENGKALHE